MFLKGVTLRRTGWYMKILKYTFPSVPMYNNFCPIFWLTMLAVILSPFKFVGKIIIFPFVALVEYTEQSQEEWINSLTDDEYNKALFLRYYDDYDDRLDCTDPEIRKLFKLRKRLNKIFESIGYRRSIRWDYDPGYALELKKFFRSKVKTVDSSTTPIKSRSEFFANLITVSKWVSTIVIGILALFCIYYIIIFLGWVGYWIIFYWNWYKILGFLLLLDISIIICCLLALAVMTIKKVFSFMVPVPCDDKPCVICEFFKSIGQWLVELKNFIVTGFKTFKANNCPHVDWID